MIIRRTTLTTVSTLALTLSFGCGATPSPAPTPTITDYETEGPAAVDQQRFEWHDPSRNDRPVTTHVWSPAGDVRPRGIVLFSHGQGARGTLHGFLTEHLASHGWVVAAPDHFGSALGTPVRDDHLYGRVDDLRFLLDRFAAEAAFSEAAERGAATVGHSVGGFAALALCGARPVSSTVSARCENGDPAFCALLGDADRWAMYADARVATCIGLTPMVASVFGAAGTGASHLQRPALLLGATEDTHFPAEPELRRFFESTPGDGNILLTLEGAGHLSFTDPLNDGTLDHETVKEITRAYTASWLDGLINGEHAALRLIEPNRVETSPWADHLRADGSPPLE